MMIWGAVEEYLARSFFDDLKQAIAFFNNHQSHHHPIIAL